MTLFVLRLHEGREPDVLMGFEESGWHFHPTESEALHIFDEVLADRVVILSGARDGERAEFELMDDLEFELGQGADDIRWTFRLWSGPVTFQDLADGKVPYVPLSHLRNWRTDPA